LNRPADYLFFAKDWPLLAHQRKRRRRRALSLAAANVQVHSVFITSLLAKELSMYEKEERAKQGTSGAL